MAQVELKMPKMGESVHEATIIRWLKNEGDHVDADETVLEIATDKVDSEVPSTAGGTLVKRLFNEGDVVQVGTAIAIISTGGADAPVATNGQATAAPTPTPAPAAAVAVPHVPAPAPVAAPVSNGARFYSPLVRTIAGAEGISQAELDGIPGTGAEGRVTKKDILAFVDLKKSGKAATVSQPASAPAATPAPAAPCHSGSCSGTGG